MEGNKQQRVMKSFIQGQVLNKQTEGCMETNEGRQQH